jgi:NAD(P)H-nitrite reductase large subunit/ferredoxin
VLAQAVGPEPVRIGAAGKVALESAGSDSLADLTIVPDDRRIAVQAGSTLLENIETSGLPIEVGCRMGVCGADPICVVEGAENLSAIGTDEKMTLERLGLAETTRMACSARVHGHVCISLTPEKRSAVPTVAAVADPAIESVVVIGNGIAGVTAADFARRRHADCEIHVIGDEPYNLYNRMAIPRLISERSALDVLSLQPPQWYEERRIVCWLNTQVTAIDPVRRRVLLADEGEVPYERLIVTAGSSTYVPPIDGFGKPGTFVLRTADDAIAVRRYLQQRRARRAVVVGGGLLGLEAAHALMEANCRVTVSVRRRLLARQVDTVGAQYLQRYLEGLGMQFVDAEVTALGAKEQLEEVVLSDGRRLPADVLLVATGVRSNVELARRAGIDVQHAIVVDDHMRTSAPDVFAAGDVAEFEGRVHGLWPTAVEQGRIAGVNAAGGNEQYRDAVVPATILKVRGADLTSVGRFETADENDVVVADEDRSGGRYRKLVVSDGRLVGAILIGYPAEAPMIVEAVKQRREVNAERLRNGDWDAVATAPTPVRKVA